MKSSMFKLIVVFCALLGNVVWALGTNLVPTTNDDPEWVLAVSDKILREDLCVPPDWYEELFSPCNNYNSYWKLNGEPVNGEAYPMDMLLLGAGDGTMDSLFVPAGYYFQLFKGDPNDPDPYGPLMRGPQYVSIDYWDEPDHRAPRGFEPDTFFVEGVEGELKDYSIVIYKGISDILMKTNDVAEGDCREPGDEITYTICWDNTTGITFEDTSIIDVLPADVNVVSADPAGVYDQDKHSYEWDLGTISPNDADCVELTVVVNSSAEPGTNLYNEADLWGTVYDNGLALIAHATEDTLVCCDQIDPDIIYVDLTATGNDNGTDWQNAYVDLQIAIDRVIFADPDCANDYKIYVAEGVYKPGDNRDDSFILPVNVEVYGGFPSGGCAFNLRHPKKYPTVLSGHIITLPVYDRTGHIVGYESYYNNTVVIMDDNTLLDGFTVEEGIRGIDASGIHSTVANCIIKENADIGIRCENGDLVLEWCEIADNSEQGVWHKGSGNSLTINNCKIYANQSDGIRTEDSTSTTLNSLIYRNGLGSIPPYIAYYGINLVNPSNSPTIRNNTIIQNINEGIRRSGGSLPEIKNCIVYYNGGDLQLLGLNPDSVADYSCIQDCNEIPTNSNFNDIPGFAYIDPNNNQPFVGNYRLAYNSLCVNTGDDNDYDEFDMDGEARVYGTLVDRGADEVFACDQDLSEDDIYNALDWNIDGTIDMEELSLFAAAWLNFGYDPIHDLNSDSAVNLKDYAIFSQDWQWTACWTITADCVNRTNVLDTNSDGVVNMVEFSQFAEVWDANWEFWNLADSGDSADKIDLADLRRFLENWLWIECARIAEFPPVAPTATSPPPVTSSTYEPTDLENAINLNDNICYLTDIWANDPNMSEQMDPNEWYIFMDSLCLELDTLVNSLEPNELMAYNLIAGEDCCTQQEAMSGGEEMFLISEAEGMMFDAEEGIQLVSPYAEMPTGELSLLAVGIYSVLDSVDTALVEGHENADNLLEARDFLEDVLLDIQASRQ